MRRITPSHGAVDKMDLYQITSSVMPVIGQKVLVT